MPLPHLLSLTLEDFRRWLTEHGQPAYRAAQIWDWIFQKLTFDLETMTNLPKPVRAMLQEAFPAILPPVTESLVDPDGTRKVAIALGDDLRVEAVAIPDDDALTFCLSTQAGCPIGCRFCRTGQGIFHRNLTTEEILVQLLVLAQICHTKPTNIVFMGMGEPFLNRESLFAAIDLITSPKGLAIGSRRITISTVGILEGIKELAARPGEVNLAVSLHAATDHTRQTLVPGAKRTPLVRLRSAIVDYLAITGRRVTFEVVLLKNVNDQVSDAHNLAQFCEGLLCHVNLVRFNPFPSSPYAPPTEAVEREFRLVLKKAGIPVTVRRSRGQSILAACGQLAGK